MVWMMHENNNIDKYYDDDGDDDAHRIQEIIPYNFISLLSNPFYPWSENTSQVDKIWGRFVAYKNIQTKLIVVHMLILLV